MDNAFFLRFYPKVIDVVKRDQSFWYGRTVRTFESSTKRNFMYITSGAGLLTLGSTDYLLGVGSVFYFPFHHKVQLRTYKDRPLQFYSVHYDYKLIDWEGGTASCLEPEQDRLPIPVVTVMVEMDDFSVNMHSLYNLWQEKATDYEWRARLLFLNAVSQVCRVNAQRKEGNLARRAIVRSLDYIKNHYAEPLEREELADIASMSVSYFSIMFKRVAGCTPTQYITKIRLDKAKQLLQCSELRVAEVAREVGFQDPLYFTRVFRNHAGMSPCDYRKM
ncbi:MAG: AraC family transcriptional regulator [Paenibacillus sp.]|jgi:AraC-like DNA-binding protein|nr:AraC family transcriptional regulator [Paenibacillus sp.]